MENLLLNWFRGVLENNDMLGLFCIWIEIMVLFIYSGVGDNEV